MRIERNVSMQRAAAHYPQRAGLFLDRGRRGAGLLAAGFAPSRHGRIDPSTLTKDDFRPDPGFGVPRISSALKRLCDLLVGGFLLVLLLPLLGLTALAIKLDSRGPIFDGQRRVGALDRPFSLFRFRSMTADVADPRLTRVGRCIRCSRIDRLPQLANVIRGDMSLVGPRPERAHVVGQLARAIPFYHQRHDVRPGLTGWAQVKLGRDDGAEDARERLAYDLYYVKNHGIMLDLIILMATGGVALSRAGRVLLSRAGRVLLWRAGRVLVSRAGAD